MEKLQKIQSELKAPKGQFNSFGKYKYRNCEDILEAVKPLLAKNKCFLIIQDEIVNIGTRYYVKAEAKIYDNDKPETFFNAIAYAREPEMKKGMDEAQITGATSSYARKYALNGLFCIDDTKDQDSNESTTQGQNQAPATTQHNNPPMPTEPTTGLPPKEQVFKKQDDDVCQDCGAPKIISKTTGNKYCSAKCWLNKKQEKPATKLITQNPNHPI